MARKSFGKYLVNEDFITKEQHEAALKIQNKNRLLSQIAVDKNCLTEEEATKISEYVEKKPGIKFGEAAISEGYLTPVQLRYLLDVRTRRKVRIGDILVKSGYISEEILHSELMHFEEKEDGLKTILVCNHSSAIISVLERILKKYNYTLFCAKTGDKALKIANEEKPDILITGADLGDMDFYDLCFKIISTHSISRMNSILISTDVKLENIKKAFDVGINHFLEIPINENELVNMLYQIQREASEKRYEKLLIVDDSPGARAVTYNELFCTWNNIFMAENGKEAIEKAKKLKPDIITMDINMPVMNGLSACKKLKEDPATENIPVVIISSSDSLTNRKLGFEVGAVEYFLKPFKPGALLQFLEILLETKKITRKGKILVVEDSPSTRHIMKYFFKKNGFKVDTAENGQEALKLLPKCLPDIVVTDMMMPKMDGVTFTRKVRELDIFRRLPIIMVTSVANKFNVLKGFAAGVTDYITKPFDESELIARVDTHLKKKILFEELEREKEKLAELNKEKNRFLGIAAHDIRNPLSHIKGFSKLLIEGNLSKEEQKDFLDIIHSSSEELLRLVNDMLDVSAIESGKFSMNKTWGDMTKLIKRRVYLNQAIAEKKGIKIETDLTPVTEAYFDSDRISQVLDNLLSNAIKFSPKNSSIKVFLKSDNINVIVEVKDEGPGIPKNEQAKLFGEFQKLSTKTTSGEKSTGLGLAIVRKIVEVHGGQICLGNSANNKGSNFVFTIPVKK